MLRRSAIVSMGVLVLVAGGSPSARGDPVPSFQGLGDLSGGIFKSQANGISADGLTVVGSSVSAMGGEAFRWTDSGGMTALTSPFSSAETVAFGVSANGSTIVGQRRHSGLANRDPVRWQGSSTAILGAGSFGSAALDVSANGSTIVGRSNSIAVVWPGGSTSQTQLETNVSSSSQALGVSADGSRIVGISFSQAIIWESGTKTNLGTLPGGSFPSRADAISADGLTIVGFANSALGEEAFIWQNNVMTGLGDLPGGSFLSHANDVSADGSTIVGYGTSALGEEAFVWDAPGGMRNLRDTLVNNLGMDLTGWTLTRANGISDDGLTVVGYGTNPSGDTEGWIATIPEPATLWLLACGGLMQTARLRRRA